MASPPQEVTFPLRPERRIDVMDVHVYRKQAAAELFDAYPHVLYCSHHTTAGFLDADACTQLGNNAGQIADFIASFHALFPFGANYQHDQMHLRTELSPKERCCEPRNADAHLTYIAAGLENCVAHSGAFRPVYFIDLDGVNKDTGHRRERYVTALGFTATEKTATFDLQVPMSPQSVDAVSLRDPRLRLFERLHTLLAQRGIRYGRVRLEMAQGEEQAGLTVNEYEPLLMEHDLARVLRDPLHFKADRRWSVSQPSAPISDASDTKAGPHVISRHGRGGTHGNRSSVEAAASLNRGDGCSTSPVDGTPLLRMKRAVDLMVTPRQAGGRGQIVQGRYQSPILLQWGSTNTPRTVRATVFRYV